MLNLETAYSEKFFARRKSLMWRAGVLCPAIRKILRPKQVIDIGCAIGDFVQWFNKHKIDAYGLEGSTQVIPHLVCGKDRVFFCDLRKEILTPTQFDLALCIEVAEHIEEKYADCFVANLCRLAPRIFLTAAGPGQGGHYHVNLQQRAYWLNKFAQQGYKNNEDVETELRKVIPINHRWLLAIHSNLIYLERTNELS
jgi:hypothetical protein